MTYEFNAGDNIADAVSNPFKTENILLALSAAALVAGAIAVLFAARDYFGSHDDKIAMVALTLASMLFGTAVKFLIQALSQIRFYLGRKFPLGLADEMSTGQVGLAGGAKELVEILRHRAVDFPEPAGPLNGILYSLIKPLITAPPPIQAAAVRHFHSVVAMLGLLVSMGVSYCFCAGGDYEGMISWMYLPMSGLSLATPFLRSKDDEANADGVGNSDKLLWKMIGLVTFAIIAPVAIPRFMPLVHIAPLWIAPLSLLATSALASLLYLASLIAQLDTVHQTSVSCEQTTVSMNCHPAQLWPKLSRDMQSNWVRDIPNRMYANVPPGAADVERGAFQGYLLEETQPTASFNMGSDNTKEALGGAHVRFLVALGCWGLILSLVSAAVAAYYAPQFGEMARMEISRVILVVIALGVSAVMAFRIGHLLWSRMYFKSRLTFVVVDGTYQTGEMRIGNQMTGNVQSRSTLTRVEDATLRVWMTDIVTVAFGKGNKRFIMAMAPTDGQAKAMVDELKTFALEQSSITTPTSSRDLERAKTIAKLNEAMGGSVDLVAQLGRSIGSSPLVAA
ncbi:hypothetical protein LPN04_31540 [Rugamonas sp. A1-17]|nr:hypothetical protein [Rugamonas sp. A1-17]